MVQVRGEQRTAAPTIFRTGEPREPKDTPRSSVGPRPCHTPNAAARSPAKIDSPIKSVSSATDRVHTPPDRVFGAPQSALRGTRSDSSGTRSAPRGPRNAPSGMRNALRRTRHASRGTRVASRVTRLHPFGTRWHTPIARCGPSQPEKLPNTQDDSRPAPRVPRSAPPLATVAAYVHAHAQRFGLSGDRR